MESRYTREELLSILGKIQGQPFNRKRAEAIKELLDTMPEEEKEEPVSTPDSDAILAAAQALNTK